MAELSPSIINLGFNLTVDIKLRQVSNVLREAAIEDLIGVGNDILDTFQDRARGGRDVLTSPTFYIAPKYWNRRRLWMCALSMKTLSVERAT